MANGNLDYINLLWKGLAGQVLWVAHPNYEKKSSGSPNKSAYTTPFVTASAPKGLREAYGLHILVPGVGVGGGTSLSNKKIFIWESQQIC